MTMLKNARLVCPDKEVFSGFVEWDKGKIIRVGEGEPEAVQGEVIDAGGLFVSAGFLDMHMHGGFGFDFGSCRDADELREALRLNALDGVTGVMPTHSGVERLTDEVAEKYAFYNEVMKDEMGPELLGVHLEGPFFPAELAPGGIEKIPDPAAVKELVEAVPCIKRMTIAPEIPNGLETISVLEVHGVTASLGHGAPDSRTVREAIARGSRQVTHLYSGMKGVYRDAESVRHPGLIELAYLYDELAVELIANGKHLDSDLIRLVFKIKGPDGIFVVTDSHARDISLRGDKTQYVLKKWSEADGKYHFNPAMPIPEMLRVMVKEAQIPLADAVKTVTATPARLLHMEKRKGKLALGYDADIAAWDEDFQVKLSVARGKEIVNQLK